MEHHCQKNIICPYCNREELYTWEFDKDAGKYDCIHCEREFDVIRRDQFAYSTFRKFSVSDMREFMNDLEKRPKDNL